MKLDFNDFENEKASMSSSWWETSTVIDYTHAVKGLTGLTFCFLGLAILFYGTKLETAMSNQQG